MRYLLFIPILLLASCSIFKPRENQKIAVTNQAVSLAGTSWELDSITAFNPEKLNAPVTLNFAADSTDRVYGYSGCNSYNGKYALNQNKIVFSRLISTKRYCLNGSKTETAFTAALLSANRIAMDKQGDLLLMDGKKIKAILHRATANKEIK